LLVVIGIIAILVGVLLPALARARRQAQTIKCAANLHNTGLAVMNYASQYRGALPQNRPAAGIPQGSWIWDLDVEVRNNLMKFGMVRANFYCPTAEAQNVHALWNYSVTPYAPDGVTPVPLSGGVDASGNSYDGPNEPRETGFSVLGYVFLFWRPVGIQSPPANTWYAQFAAGPYPTPAASQRKHWDYQRTLRPFNTPAGTFAPKANVSSQTEMVVDAMVSNGVANPLVWGNVKGGYQIAGSVYPHQSAHWYGGASPAGMNVLFMDGHVDWRPYKTNGSIVDRTANGTVVFWW